MTNVTRFPSPDEWYATVLHPEDTHPWNFRQLLFYDEYKQKYAIAKLARPKAILEIGVRFGYSARSFLMAAPKADYTGIDFDEPSWGPFKGIPREWAYQRLSALYPNNYIRTYHSDTQKEPVREKFLFGGLGKYDFVHIDGDHSFDGALHDMQEFWQVCTRVMVVDDVIEIPAVRDAVAAFMKATPDAMMIGTPASLRGSALIVRA